MLITTQNEIISMMPTARWDKPQELFGYIEEEEAVALEPLLGSALYRHVLAEYDRLRAAYTDITATTVRPTGKAKEDARLAHADVTERLEQIQQGKYRETFVTPTPGEKSVPEEDMAMIKLIRYCQQIEFYQMLAHKAGLLGVSFNGGGGFNSVSAEGYDPADDKQREEMRKDAWMSAGRSTDSLLLYLEADAKGAQRWTKLWREADAFYLHKDLLFQTAKTLNEFLDIKGERKAYVALVRDIRFCQNAKLEPNIGLKLLKAAIAYANEGTLPEPAEGEDVSEDDRKEAMGTLVEKLRIALAFYTEARRVSLEPAREKLARRDSTVDADQALAQACRFIGEHLRELGEAAVGTPIYTHTQARKEQEERDRTDAEAAQERRRRAACEQQRKHLFTAFPASARSVETK